MSMVPSPDELKVVIEKLAAGTETSEDIEVLRQAYEGSERISVQVGKHIVNIGQGQDIQIGDRIFQGADPDTIRRVFREVLEASSIHPTAPFHIYIVSQNDEGLRLDSYSFPYNDIKKNRDYPSFLGLLNQLPNLKIQPNMCVVFRITDEVTLDRTNATDNANTGVIVIPQAVLEVFGDSHLAFTYIKSCIENLARQRV